jgi:hypothetical protein
MPDGNSEKYGFTSVFIFSFINEKPGYGLPGFFVYILLRNTIAVHAGLPLLLTAYRNAGILRQCG